MRWKLLLAVIVFAFVFSSVGTSAAALNFLFSLEPGATGRLSITTPDTGGSFRQQTQGNDLVWVNNLYEVRITPRLEGGITYLRLHMEGLGGRSLNISGVGLAVAVPAEGVAGVWTPSGRVSSDTLISSDARTPFVTSSAANYGIPFIGSATASGRNSLAVGLLDQSLPVEIRATPPGPNLTELSLNAALSQNGRTLDQDFFVSTDRSRSWYETAEAYADWVDAGTQYSPFPISDRSYEPVYDTWYWSQDNVDDALYAQTGEAASQTGFGTFLADSGWDAPAGEYDKWLSGRTGDYAAPAEKFADLRQTLDDLRTRFHLQVQLWLQPFAVGRTSARYAQTRAMHIQIVRPADSLSFAPFSLPLAGTTNLENVNLCPMVTATHQYLKSLFTEMSQTYHPEAYWLDFIDGMPAYCVASHQHNFNSFGAGLRQALQTIRNTILSLEQDPVIQFRAQYANLHNKSFANVWQPFDSPNNFERMRLDSLRLRPFSKGVVFASDQLYWPSDADDETVSRFVIADFMSGVPAIGANLLELSPSALEIVKNWMDFYRTYRIDLTTGRFRPFGRFEKPNHLIESDERIFAYIVSNGRVFFSARGKKEIFLLNAAGQNAMRAAIAVAPESQYELRTFDRYVQPTGVPVPVAAQRGFLDLDASVEPGGFLALTRQD